MTCAVCGGGTRGYLKAEINGERVPVCSRDWGRLRRHTRVRLFNLAGEEAQRGLGRPARKPDPEIIAWAGEALGAGARRFRYNELGPIGGAKTAVVVDISEAEILATYYPWWQTQMRKVGKADQISPEACIEDFLVVHWAWEVK